MSGVGIPESTPALASPQPQSFWSTITEAIRGSHQDFTEAPVAHAVVLLAVPMVLEMLMESVFVVADVFFVGRLGADAVATVGITESWMTVMYALAAGLSIGATAMVARRIGATFSRVMLGGCGTVLLLFLMNAVFRGAGDAAIAMRVLWFANAINIVLGPCLIFGLGPFPELGVTGAAVATTIGRGSGVLYQLYRLTRGDARVAVRRIHLALRPAIMANLLRLSGSGTFQVLVGTASYVGLVRIMSTFGSQVLAGYTISIRILIFALLPAWGLANAAATMVGQSLGAGDPDRAERAAWLASRYNMVVLGAVGLVFIVLAGPIIGLFTHDPVALPTGALGLRTMSFGFVFYALGMRSPRP